MDEPKNAGILFLGIFIIYIIFSFFLVKPYLNYKYPCTIDCSGHIAGYEYAEFKEFTRKKQCTGNSQSFREGCYQFIEEKQILGLLFMFLLYLWFGYLIGYQYIYVFLKDNVFQPILKLGMYEKEEGTYSVSVSINEIFHITLKKVDYSFFNNIELLQIEIISLFYLHFIYITNQDISKNKEYEVYNLILKYLVNKIKLFGIKEKDIPYQSFRDFFDTLSELYYFNDLDYFHSLKELKYNIYLLNIIDSIDFNLPRTDRNQKRIEFSRDFSNLLHNEALKTLGKK